MTIRGADRGLGFRVSWKPQPRTQLKPKPQPSGATLLNSKPLTKLTLNPQTLN